jgi:hypothetical protein
MLGLLHWALHADSYMDINGSLAFPAWLGLI